MKKTSATILIAITTFMLFGCEQVLLTNSTMVITSLSFADQGKIPSNFTCDGKGVSPALQFTDVPENTKSLALTVHDPDVPNGGFTHWVMWNIPPQAKSIEENAPPAEAVQGYNSEEYNRWTAPCPPSGTHHYQFTLYALNTMLDLPFTANKAKLENAMQGHIIAQNTLTGLYSPIKK